MRQRVIKALEDSREAGQWDTASVCVQAIDSMMTLAALNPKPAEKMSLYHQSNPVFPTHIVNMQ